MGPPSMDSLDDDVRRGDYQLFRIECSVLSIQLLDERSDV